MGFDDVKLCNLVRLFSINTMKLQNEVVLRPRFKLVVPMPVTEVIERLQTTPGTASTIYTSILDGHIFIKINKEERHFWSPHLHIESEETDDNQTLLKGTFGPNPTAWTFFMFLHFVLAGCFLAAAIWCYTNVVVGASTRLPVIGMVVIVLLWIAFYVLGRLGKKKAEPQSRVLYEFLQARVSHP